MKNLDQHSLDSDRTFEYVKSVLEEVNELSIELLENLDFKLGHFFTYLPSDARIERIYEFSCGGILPEGINKEITVLGKKYQAEIINNLQNELKCFIINKLREEKYLSCILDDVLRDKNDKSLQVFQDNDSLKILKNEVYYLFNEKSADESLIDKSIQHSNAIWHSLCILYYDDSSKTKSNNLTSEIIKKIVTNAIIVIIGAYDGEGYIFWEKGTS